MRSRTLRTTRVERGKLLSNNQRWTSSMRRSISSWAASRTADRTLRTTRVDRGKLPRDIDNQRRTSVTRRSSSTVAAALGKIKRLLAWTGPFKIASAPKEDTRKLKYSWTTNLGASSAMVREAATL